MWYRKQVFESTDYKKMCYYLLVFLGVKYFSNEIKCFNLYISLDTVQRYLLLPNDWSSNINAAMSDFNIWHQL